MNWRRGTLGQATETEWAPSASQVIAAAAEQAARYEERISNQKASIDRLVDQLEQAENSLRAVGAVTRPEFLDALLAEIIPSHEQRDRVTSIIREALAGVL